MQISVTVLCKIDNSFYCISDVKSYTLSELAVFGNHAKNSADFMDTF